MFTSRDLEADARPATEQAQHDGPVVLQKTELERLGRQRPEVFKTTLSEVLFCMSLLASMLMSEFFISGFNILLPTVSSDLAIPPSAQIWPSSVFSLVAGALLLPIGRIADDLRDGGRLVFATGLAWFLVWTLAAGFSRDHRALVACRALQGMGPAAFLPAGLSLLGRAYRRPGPRKNLVFSLYGAFAPLGFFLGILVGGAAGQYLSWRWYFWLGAVVIFAAGLGAAFAVPREEDRDDGLGGAQQQQQKKKKRSCGEWGRDLDGWGVVTTVPALVLVVFAVTEGAHAPRGWATGYVIATFVVGAVLLGVAVVLEGWVVARPLLPGSLFRPKYMKTLVASLVFGYGNFGIFIFYASFYLTDVMGYSTIQTALAFTPMAVGGILLSTFGGFTLHLLPGRLLLILSGAGNVACVLLFALIPEGGSNWAYILPAMIGATLGVDIMFNVTNVFITTNIPQKHQGAAGALINSLVFLPISLFTGLADVVAASYEWKGEMASYKAAFWFGTGCAAASLVLFFFIDTGKAESQLRVEEQDVSGGGSK